MSGKVKCTCGWSWNKSDSSKKDMYICHECGKDNSNNMKNGGWLDNYGEQDNYNDSEVSLPEGFVGEGIFNGPKFDNPAWGGQFQMGGNVYPVNYVPEAQTGGSFPGATGFSYARTGSIPSKGPRRNQTDKTDASAQNGKEMQYYQNGLDWKPKSISQDGSKLDYHTGDKVTYGTPEYREAYNRGEVITDEGVRSPIQLDEVVIKGKKKDKNWLEQYASKIAEENRDAGLLGAIIGTPISAITSLPQLMGMKALTGEMQRPSEGLDIKNPYGAMAVDAITDPTNLTGVGLLTKEKALAKLAASKESGLLSNAYKYNPWAFKSNPEAYYRTLGKEGIDDAFNSGVIRPKQTSNIYSPEAGKRIDVNAPAFPEGSYFNKSGLYSTNDLYNPDYIAEVVGKDELFTYPKRTVFNENIRVAPNNIPIEEANFYKKDWLQGYKEVPKQEDGGIIKDDNGYWNPDNWGKAVEIRSNDITMEGVYEPLLGISDTGDTKLMKPGKNYKFKGKKVTEYPMAKNGLRQEQKGLQNLEDLTNFTNYNKPTNWLNKYN